MSKRKDTIILLSDRDKVRQRPGMYIGDNSKLGLITICREVLDNAVDEYPNFPDKSKPIVVTLHADNSLTIRDHGRGISPYESSANPGEIEERLAFTRIGAGGKFKQNRRENGNQFSGGLNGTGAAATNFMSEFFDVTIWKDGRVFHDRFENGGEPVVALKRGKLPSEAQKGKEQTGTQIHFKADATAMQTTKIDAHALERIMTHIKYLNPGLRIEFTNERDGEDTKIFESERGLLDYIDVLATDEDGKKASYLIEPFLISGDSTATVLGSDINMHANIAVAFSRGEEYATEAFTNGIRNAQHGEHVNGFKTGLIKLLRHYYHEFQSDIDKTYKRQIDLIKKVNNTDDVFKLVKPKDALQQVFVVIDFKHEDPVLVPQTKDKLASEEAAKAVEEIFFNNAMLYLDKNVKAVHDILGYLIKTLYEEAKEEDSNVKLSKKEEKLLISQKLAIQRSEDPTINELFIVEGDSAAGSLKSYRNPEYQAVLPLRGKVLNVQKAPLSKVITNIELSTLIAVLGCGIGKNFDITKLRYNKIIIATDQDDDGLHIRTLLLTFFLRFMPELVTGGYVYFLDTPLFVNELKEKKAKAHYTYSLDEQTKYLAKHKSKISRIRRNKGLGELGKELVIETILTAETRRLFQATISDMDLMLDIVESLMGDSTAGRKALIWEEGD